MPIEHQTQATTGDLFRREAGDVLAIEPDGTGGGFDKAADAAEQGGFSCTIGAQHQDDLPGHDAEIDPPQHGDAAVSRVESADLKHRRPQ